MSGYTQEADAHNCRVPGACAGTVILDERQQKWGLSLYAQDRGDRLLDEFRVRQRCQLNQPRPVWKAVGKTTYNLDSQTCLPTPSGAYKAQQSSMREYALDLCQLELPAYKAAQTACSLSASPPPTPTRQIPTTPPTTLTTSPPVPHLIYRGNSSHVITLDWSPDDQRIASAGQDSTVQVWDALNGSHPFIYRGHIGTVCGLGWSPDGKRIASASYDGTVQVWQAGG